MKARLMVNGTEAILDENGRWSGDDAKLVVYLNAAFPDKLYPPSPSNGSFPREAQARAAAAKMGGRISLQGIGDGEFPDRVY